jgi:HK97 family phage portal protein
MAFWNRQGKAIETEREVFEPIFGSGGSMPRVSMGNRISAADLVKRYGMMVHRCVTVKSQTAANIPLRLYAIGNPKQMRKTNFGAMDLDPTTKAFLRGRMSVTPSVKVQGKIRGNMENMVELTDHPLLTLLTNVNPYTEGFSWRESIYADMDIFGRSFHAKVQPNPNKPPTSLWRMQPQLMKVLPDAEKFVAGFEYGTGSNKKTFEPEDVLWFRCFDPFDPLGGFGALEAWIKTVDAEFAHASFVDWIYNKGGSPDYVVTAKNGMSVDQKKAFRSEWRKMFSKLFNRRENVAILSGEGDITPLGRTPRDLESVEQDNVLRDKIAIAFGVPKSLITSDDVNLANAKEGSITFLRNSVMPMVQKVEDTLNEQLVPMWSDRLILVHDNPIIEDKRIMIDERASMLKSGFTVDEVREMEGQTLLETPESQTPMLRLDVMPLELVGADVQVGELDKAPAEEIQTKAAEPELPSVVSQKGLWLGTEKIDCGCNKTYNDPTPDPDFVNDVFKAQNRMADDIIKSLRNMKAAKGSVSVAFNDRVIDQVMNEEQMAIWADDMAAAVGGNLAAIAEATGSSAIQSVTVGFVSEGLPEAASTVFDLQNTRVQQFLLEQTNQVSVYATGTHKHGISMILGQGVALGLNPQQMSKKLRGLKEEGSGIFNKYQADRIVRTETAFAQTNALIEGWKQSGVVKGKEFLLAPEACVYCDAIAKMWKGKNIELTTALVGFNEQIEVKGKKPMVADYRELQGAPIHPNCMCDILPVILTGGA